MNKKKKDISDKYNANLFSDQYNEKKSSAIDGGVSDRGCTIYNFFVIFSSLFFLQIRKTSIRRFKRVWFRIVSLSKLPGQENNLRP